MADKNLKSKWRKILRKRRRKVDQISSDTDDGIEKHFIRRLVNFPQIQRFLAGWLGLLMVLSIGVVLQTRALSNKYQTLQPKPGGNYVEGVIGQFTNANPLYASGPVDSSVSRLVFSGLLKHDENNKLVGDLAEKWSIDPTETIYTVKLRDNLKWHDGQPLTSKDVAFTYKLIQDPETKSFLNPSWQNIKIEATDDKTIVFSLSNSLSSFPYSLTNGIVPEHLLKDINPAQLRSNPFNNESPTGSGAFKFSKVEVVGTTPNTRQERIALNGFESYHSGQPKLDNFIIKTFGDETSLTAAYNDKEINAMVGLASLPDQLITEPDTQEFGVPLTGEVLVFFKTTQEVLKDNSVRKALVLATDKKEIFKQLQYPLASVDGPLLRSHVGYDKSILQTTGKPEEARKILDAAGWVVDPATKIRSKAGQKLSFRLYSQTTNEYSTIASALQNQWREIGVDMQVELQSDQELQSTLALHNYDALLYGISIGADPDVFAYWHSTQTDPRSSTRLNFSEYKSSSADKALEGGRTRSDPQLRKVKYKPFLEAWKNDAPALALYQPRFLYVVRKPFYNFEVKAANSSSDRFTNVEQWMIREDRR